MKFVIIINFEKNPQKTIKDISIASALVYLYLKKFKATKNSSQNHENAQIKLKYFFLPLRGLRKETQFNPLLERSADSTSFIPR